MSRTVFIGLTGLAGSGKSAVARIFERLGAVVIDADAVAREVLERPATLASLREQLGEELWSQIVNSEGVLDRRRLRALISKDRNAKRILEGLTHPQIAERIAAAMRSAIEQNAKAIVVEAALLVGSGFEKFFDAVVFVKAPREVCAKRIAKRDGVSIEDALALLDVQPDSKLLERSATHVLENVEDLGELEKRVESLWTKLVNYNK